MVGPLLVLEHKDEHGSPRGENPGRRQGVENKKVPKRKILKYKNKILKREGQHSCTLQLSVVFTGDSHQFRKG